MASPPYYVEESLQFISPDGWEQAPDSSTLAEAHDNSVQIERIM